MTHYIHEFLAVSSREKQGTTTGLLAAQVQEFDHLTSMPRIKHPDFKSFQSEFERL